MKISKEKIYLYFSSTATVVISIPFFNSASIGSDWDSYAIIGTYLNFIDIGLYFPSRPPGFPLYELLIGVCITISEIFNIPMEQFILFVQLVLLVSLNYLVFSFFKKNKNSNYFIYSIGVLSPVFLISGLTAIDYILGSLLGFWSLYISMYSKNQYKDLLISFTLALSIATRLSNVIFLVVVFISMRKDFKKAFKVVLYSGFIFTSIYLMFYINLYNFYIKNGIYENWVEFLCIFNLTNTNHDFYNRIGRFTLKQIPFLGTLGTIIFLLNFPKLKFNLKNNNFYFFLLFLFFQLSFLRLPTEEGHLLPAFISFAIFISHNKNKIFFTIFLFAFSSNFLNLKFYEVDSIDSAKEINFMLSIEEGYLLQDYNLRNERAQNKDFYYNNSKISVYNAWSTGCPNK